MTRGSWVLLGTLLGCSGDKPGTDTDSDTDTDTDSDTDTDTDSDTDTDTDSDTDTDTDTGNSPVDGRWQGDCLPPVSTTTDTGYDYFDFVLGWELRLDLTEQGGDVEGDGLLGIQQITTIGYSDSADTASFTFHTTTTTYVFPIGTRGSWDGTELVLTFADTYYNPPYPLPLELTAAISGDTMTGALVLYPSGTSGYPAVPFDCTLTRQ